MAYFDKSGLKTLFTGYSAAFQAGIDAPHPFSKQWESLAQIEQSSTSEQEYGFITNSSNIREWLGSRVVNSIVQNGYAIKNKTFEETIGVKREHIEDGVAAGMYATLMKNMGMNVRDFPNRLVFDLLARGTSTLCADGQFFFDTDHPMRDATGNIVSTGNNFGGGTGTAWYIIDTTRALKPIIYQNRRDFTFISKSNLEDDNVFLGNEYLFGSDGRCNVGYGLWQTAYCSRQPLTAAAVEAAIAQMMAYKKDNGSPMGIMPTTLIVPPSLNSAAKVAVGQEYQASGANNVTYKTLEIMNCPWLS